jgi:hypothetical protein
MTAGRLAIILMVLVGSSRMVAAEDLFIGGFGGGTVHSATGFVALEQDAAAGKLAIGLSAGWLPDGWLGCEAEVAVVPGLFGDDAGLVSSSRGVAVNGNLLVTLPRTGGWRVRPYGTLGAGAFSVRMRDVADVFTTRTTLPAINGGGGVVARLNSRLAVRGDLRYLRTAFRDPPAGQVAIGSWFVHFWRGSAGVVVRF